MNFSKIQFWPQLKIADERDGIVTIGITPTYPATGYGYVKTAEDITGTEKIKQFKVDRFVEKPDEATATVFETRWFLLEQRIVCF